MGLTLFEREAIQRKHAQNATPYLESKGYKRDIPNNEFIKRYGQGFFQYYSIRYYEKYIIISDADNPKSNHKKIIENHGRQ